MESEKVKDIKECLELLNEYKGTYITKDHAQRKVVKYADILTLINDLESENAYQKEHIEMWFRKNEEKKDRIAELEKENERLKTSDFNSCQELDNACAQIHSLEVRIAELENTDYYKENEKKKEDLLCKEYGLIKYEKEITGKYLKHFAERLKAKMDVREYMGVKYKQGVFSENDIDETLKECINGKV